VSRAHYVVCTHMAPASFAAARSTITGVVEDTSGAALAHARVEAASNVLIERVRTAITNREDRYAIINLSFLSFFGLVKNVPSFSGLFENMT
jgi:hypothetical protein